MVADDRSRLVPSFNAKPRLKWTTQLHERFVEAVSRLGGADRATPRSVMRMMGVPGITLYHLKSHLQAFLDRHDSPKHVYLLSCINLLIIQLPGLARQLQKYRLAVRRHAAAASDADGDGERIPRLADYSSLVADISVAANCRTEDGHDTHVDVDMEKDGTENNQCVLQIMQMELQRKLHEQIEVQSRLQLRIEAQGKYLQSVLRKAQETLAGYSLDHPAKASAELSEMVSEVDTAECLSSTVSGGSAGRPPAAEYCSGDSCLTSPERPDRKDPYYGFPWFSSAGGYDETAGANAGRPTNTAGDVVHQIDGGNEQSGVWEECGGVSEEIDLNR